MRKHGGTPSRRDKHVTLAAISPPGVARGRFVGGQQSGLAGCKPPPLFTSGASSCSSQGRRQGEPWGASPRPSAPTYLPTCAFPLEVCLKHCSQRGCDSLEPFDKLLVKSTQSNELSNLMNRSWRRPTSNDLDLFGVHVYSILVDDVSTEGYSTLKECGFIDAGKELVLTE